MFIPFTLIGTIFIVFILYLWHRSERNGWFLKHGLESYHSKVSRILLPYMASEFAKSILDNHASNCKSLSKQVSEGKMNEDLRILCERHNDLAFVETYAMIAIVYLSQGASTYDEEKNALDLLVGSLRKKLLQKEEIPPVLHHYFPLDEGFLPFRY